MNGEPIRRTITISNPQGLHMRPITAFVEAAGKFQSDVYICKGSADRVNGKSAFSLLGLAAEQGTVLTVEVDGPDAQAALEALVEILLRVPDEDAPDNGAAHDR